MIVAENTLLRKQIEECGKDKAYILELEHRIKSREVKEERLLHLEQRILKMVDLCKKYKTIIQNITQKRKKR